jgi:FAD/FMN-containing dehydrogenase
LRADKHVADDQRPTPFLVVDKPVVAAEDALSKGTDAMTQTLTQHTVDDLRARLRGPVVAAGDGEYEEVRKIWNAAIEKRPAVFARCIGNDDVVAALNFARERGMEVAVRSGGHNVAGTALTNGGLVIDLQLMRAVEVDAERRRLHVQAGARLRDVDRATEPFGLALVSGINSETGLAGLTLGGGIGWLMRKYGLTIDHVISSELVTVEGGVLEVSEDRNPDLFWAIRGGGGNFGIVTSFEFDLVPLGPEVYSGIVLYSAEDAGAVLRHYREWAASAPDEVTTILMLRRNAFPWSGPELQGRAIVGVGALYSGPADNGQAALAPLQEFGTVLASSVGKRLWTQHQSMIDASAPAGRLYYWKSHYLPGLSDAAIDVIVANAWQYSSPYSLTLLSHMGGAIRRQSEEGTAFSGRDTEFTININCGAIDANLYTRDRTWVREWFDALTPHSSGGMYVNFIPEDSGEDARDVYGESKYRRLSEVKSRYDPHNVLRTNQNIKPA